MTALIACSLKRSSIMCIDDNEEPPDLGAVQTTDPARVPPRKPLPLEEKVRVPWPRRPKRLPMVLRAFFTPDRTADITPDPSRDFTPMTFAKLVCNFANVATATHAAPPIKRVVVAWLPSRSMPDGGCSLDKNVFGRLNEGPAAGSMMKAINPAELMLACPASTTTAIALTMAHFVPGLDWPCILHVLVHELLVTTSSAIASITAGNLTGSILPCPRSSIRMIMSLRLL
mmetsp:Transcript_2954/g.7529  ORF Transcript_2954/g.7529 Transcript_2954/m.7529 type:complete len:229 (+) Transcript_2954:2745-3431(+)